MEQQQWGRGYRDHSGLVGPGLCGTSENSVMAKFAEFYFHALGL
jgi:hypothetical protein